MNEDVSIYDGCAIGLMEMISEAMLVKSKYLYDEEGDAYSVTSWSPSSEEQISAMLQDYFEGNEGSTDGE